MPKCEGRRTDAFDAVAGFGEKVSGHVRMSVPTISGELLLADAVADFCQQHPGLTVEMSLDNRFVNLVEEGSTWSFAPAIWMTRA